MKFVRILKNNRPVWGLLEGETVKTLLCPPYDTVAPDGHTVPFREAVLLAPCEPTKLVCVGKNYHDHVLELHGDEAPPTHPILFLKGPNALANPGDAIVCPPFVNRLDYEGELAFVIKKTAKNVKAKEAFDYILGYTCLNDVTARDVQQLDVQWTRAKSMDGFAPVGPLLTDEVDPSALRVQTRLNGVVRQASSTALFMTRIPEMLEFITASMTLVPGDLVTTGTPAGIGPMVSGDVVEVEIEGIGVLRNTVA